MDLNKFIKDFIHYNEGNECPVPFVLWAGYDVLSDGHESAIDGALSVRGAKALAEESSKWQSLTGVPDSFKPSKHSHGWAEINDKPSEFTPAAHKHTWADITGAPKWVLKSDYEAKIEALEARLAALEKPAGG